MRSKYLSVLPISTSSHPPATRGLAPTIPRPDNDPGRPGGSEDSGGATGVVLGMLGASCAMCGTAVLAGLFSLVGAGGILTLLPLDGLEFTFAALVALVLSIHWLAEGFRGETIRGCPVGVIPE